MEPKSTEGIDRIEKDRQINRISVCEATKMFGNTTLEENLVPAGTVHVLNEVMCSNVKCAAKHEKISNKNIFQ
jgi:hypothetical protein